MKKKIKIENPFRVSVYRGTYLSDCYSYKKKKDALNKFGEIIPDYFDKLQKDNGYQYKINLSHIKMTKNGVQSKILLEASQPK